MDTVGAVDEDGERNIEPLRVGARETVHVRALVIGVSLRRLTSLLLRMVVDRDALKLELVEPDEERVHRDLDGTVYERPATLLNFSIA